MIQSLGWTRRGPSFAVVLLLAALGTPTQAQEPPLVRILKQELQRNFGILKQKADPAPYFINYSVTDQHVVSLGATLGLLTSNNENRSRLADVTLRVGDYQLDNYHRIRGPALGGGGGALSLSLDDDPDSIQASLWNLTDRKYREAAERLIRIDRKSTRLNSSHRL